MQQLVSKLAVFSVALGSIGLLLSMFLGVGDVVGMQLRHPVPGTLEFTESTMVLVVFGGIAWAQIRRAHIRVELVYLQVGKKMRSAMDIIASVAGIVFFALLTWQGGLEAVYSWQIGEATSGLLRFPLWPARWILVFGSVLMILQFLLDLWHDITRFGDPHPVEFG
ncbi:TRAP transporter small permease subunit [Ruixingdingia sedimenti]|nr:TRAP transporter small permease [Xinfangfangia sp. LG-4]